jgi:hypothetical protein
VKSSHFNRLRANELGNSATHFIGGFIGKRECDNLLRRHSFADKMCDTMRHNSGLPATGACQNKHWPVDVRGCESLLVIERIQRNL